MALAPQNEEAFLREVDEELRRAQLAGFWRRYGRWLLVAVVVGLALFGGWLWWQHEQRRSAGADGETMNAILEDLGQNKQADAGKKLDQLVTSDHEGYRAAALLTKAAVAIEKGDRKAAIAQYKLVAGDPKLAQPFRDLALIRQTTVEFDDLQPAAIIDRMKPLAVVGSPWLGSAGELLAGAHLRAGQTREAGQVFALIARETTVPETLRARAAKMAGQLGVDVLPAPAAAKE